MKVKSESEVAQSCPTLSDPMDCSLPGSSIHGIFQALNPSPVHTAQGVTALSAPRHLHCPQAGAGLWDPHQDP